MRRQGAAVCSATATCYVRCRCRPGTRWWSAPVRPACRWRWRWPGRTAGRRMVERADVGGTCINVGCTPTKTLVASARVAALAARAAEYGLEARPGEDAVGGGPRAREQAVVGQFRAGGERRLRDAGVALLRGEARFVGPRRLAVSGPGRDGRGALRAGGGARTPAAARAGRSSGAGLGAGARLVLDPHRAPSSPTGCWCSAAGYIALELGQVFRRLGAEVTVVEAAPRLGDAGGRGDLPRRCRGSCAPRASRSTSAARAMRAGQRRSAGVRLELEGGRCSRGRTCSSRWAGRRTPRRWTAPAGGVALDRTASSRWTSGSAPRPRASTPLGDVTGAPQFTHVSYDDYRVLRAELLGGPPRSPAGRLVPYTLFTDPQLGRVGLTEAEARARGLPIRVARLPMTARARGPSRQARRAACSGRWCTPGRTASSASRRWASRVASWPRWCRPRCSADLPWTVLRDAIFPHPGLAESLNNLFDAWVRQGPGRPVVDAAPGAEAADDALAPADQERRLLEHPPAARGRARRRGSGRRRRRSGAGSESRNRPVRPASARGSRPTKSNWSAGCAEEVSPVGLDPSRRAAARRWSCSRPRRRRTRRGASRARVCSRSERQPDPGVVAQPDRVGEELHQHEACTSAEAAAFQRSSQGPERRAAQSAPATHSGKGQLGLTTAPRLTTRSTSGGDEGEGGEEDLLRLERSAHAAGDRPGAACAPHAQSSGGSTSTSCEPTSPSRFHGDSPRACSTRPGGLEEERRPAVLPRSRSTPGRW